jgi:hypothetical protein
MNAENSFGAAGDVGADRRAVVDRFDAVNIQTELTPSQLSNGTDEMSDFLKG